MLGVERLSRGQDRARPRGRARLAALFAVLPGMGAVYNRQNIKAVVAIQQWQNGKIVTVAPPAAATGKLIPLR